MSTNAEDFRASFERAREGRPSTASLGSTTVIFINTRRVVVSGQGLTPASSGSSRLILPGDLHTREQQVLRLVVWVLTI